MIIKKTNPTHIVHFLKKEENFEFLWNLSTYTYTTDYIDIYYLLNI